MREWFTNGGFMMWPILASAVLCVVAAVRALRPGDGAPVRTTAARDGILFWGGVAAVLGLLGTAVGIAQMGRIIERAGNVTPALAWGGVRVALTTSQFGFLVLLVALALWGVVSRRSASA